MDLGLEILLGSTCLGFCSSLSIVAVRLLLFRLGCCLGPFSSSSRPCLKFSYK